MFNLIVAVISIALIAALAAASFYYGGEAYTEKGKKADYAEIVNGGTQIQAAMDLYKLRNGQYPAGIGADEAAATEELLNRLVSEDYLSGYPEGTWVINGLVIKRELQDVQQCESVNDLSGFDTTLVLDGCPSCTDTSYTLWPACVNS